MRNLGEPLVIAGAIALVIAGYLFNPDHPGFYDGIAILRAPLSAWLALGVGAVALIAGVITIDRDRE